LAVGFAGGQFHRQPLSAPWALNDDLLGAAGLMLGDLAGRSPNLLWIEIKGRAAMGAVNGMHGQQSVATRPLPAIVTGQHKPF
jgi:hypothetical protein